MAVKPARQHTAGHLRRFWQQGASYGLSYAVAFALVATSISRDADVAARYGGEEFAAILPGTDSAGAMAVAEHIRTNVMHLNIEHALSSWGRVTLSLGVAAWVPSAEASSSVLVSCADKALYSAKDAGRNVTVSASADIPT